MGPREKAQDTTLSVAQTSNHPREPPLSQPSLEWRGLEVWGLNYSWKAKLARTPAAEEGCQQGLPTHQFPPE